MTMSEVDKKMLAYAKKFGDTFPIMPLGWGRTDEEVIEIIDRCLKTGKDAYELGYVEDDDDIKY